MKLILAFLALIAPAAANAQIITGAATAVDGDSLTMGDMQVRLHGIDAPEGQQTCQRNGTTWNCGAEAADRLKQLLQGKQVTCRGKDTDKYGRVVATCTANGFDVAEVMISSGLATALPQFPMLTSMRKRERRQGKLASGALNSKPLPLGARRIQGLHRRHRAMLLRHQPSAGRAIHLKAA